MILPLVLLASLSSTPQDRSQAEWDAVLASAEGGAARSELAALGDRGAAMAADLIAEGSDEAAIGALAVLLEQGEKGLRAHRTLLRTLKDEEVAAARRAKSALALGASGDRGKKVVGELAEILLSRAPDEVALSAQIALVQIGKSSAKVSAKLLDAPSIEARLFGAGVLHALGPDAEASGKACLKMLEDEEGAGYYALPILVDVLHRIEWATKRGTAKTLAEVEERQSKVRGFWLFVPIQVESKQTIFDTILKGQAFGMNGPPVLDRRPQLADLDWPDYQDINGDGHHSYSEWIQALGFHHAKKLGPLVSRVYSKGLAFDGADWDEHSQAQIETWHLTRQLLPDVIKEGK